jgi:phosphohistidine phosphatase
MELYLLRHGHAGDPGAWDGPDDRRPLSDKGEKQSDRLGRFLAGIGFGVDAIITSPKVRAAQTARIVAAQLGVTIGEDDRLGAEVDIGTLESILRDAGNPTRVMVVGHDPDFTDLVTTLCGAARISMKKGALARIDADRPLEPGGGTLRWLVPPDLLRPER